MLACLYCIVLMCCVGSRVCLCVMLLHSQRKSNKEGWAAGPFKLTPCPLVVISPTWVRSRLYYVEVFREAIPSAGRIGRYAQQHPEYLTRTRGVVRAPNMGVRSGTTHLCLDPQPMSVDAAAEGSALTGRLQ